MSSIIADPAHGDDLRMAARGQEQAIGKRREVGEPRGQCVRFQMIDRHQRFAVDHRNRFGGGEPDNHPADQAGAGRRRHAMDLMEAATGFVHGPGDQVVENLDMRAGGDFRYHAAKGGMFIGLRQYDVRPDNAAAVRATLDNSRRGLVARRLDSEYKHSGPGRNRMSPIWRHRRSIARSDGAIG